MKIKIFLCFFVIVTSVTAETFPPRLVDVPQDHLVVHKGDSFKLRCKSPQPVNWTYPVHGNETKVKSTMSDDTDYPYVSILEVVDADVNDTGYYTCFFKGTVDILNSNAVSKIYVYVNDPVNLLVPHDTFILGYEHKSAVIPCRPSSPDVEITLSNEYDEVVESDSRIDFDPRKGFQINFVNFDDMSIYHCQAKRGDVTQMMTIVLYILTASNGLEAPIIKLETEHPEGRVEVGSRFAFSCSVSLASGIKFRIQWDVPNNVAAKEGRLAAGFTTSTQSSVSEVKGCKTLEVQDARLTDTGPYTCTVMDHNGHQEATTFYISVFDKDENYISIDAKENSLYENTIAFVGNDVKWVVNFTSNPTAKITWFDSRGKNVAAYHNVFKITNTPNSSTLQIYNVTFTHSGVYTLEIDNSKERRTVMRKLQVSGAPVVLEISSGITNKLSTDKSHYNLNCKILTNVNPTNVEWSFKKCYHFSNCSTEEIKLHGYSIKNGSTQYEIISQIMVNTNESGYVTCKAANKDFGNSNAVSFPFFVSDVREAVEVRSYPSFPIIGEEVILSCRTSKFLFQNTIQWFKDDVKLTEALVFKTDSEHSFGRNVVIKTLAKKYFGTYKCTALDVNNQIRSSTVDVNVTRDVPLGAKIVMIAVTSLVLIVIFMLILKIFKSSRKVTLLSTAISQAKQSRNDEILR